jgi:hypothetical protein
LANDFGKEVMIVRDDIDAGREKAGLDQSGGERAPAQAWWVSLMPLMACLGLAAVVLLLSFHSR